MIFSHQLVGLKLAIKWYLKETYIIVLYIPFFQVYLSKGHVQG